MKKFNVFTCLFYVTAFAGCAYTGFFLGSIIHPDMTIYTFVPALKEHMSHPFSLTVTAYTPYTIAAVFLTALLYLMVQKTNRKNYRFGREHGSARWAEAAALTKQLGDKGGYHRILSENMRLSLNTRKTMRNNNIFCIGGSGAGKSMFLIKCNLMEMQGSFAATDPKGELLGSAGGYLKANGYRIKVFNLINPKESNRYNPFAYIRTETDVIKLITNLIKNTTPKKSSSNDPFWEKSEGLFLQSLFYYVWMEMPPGRKNIVSVLELLAEAKVEKDEPSRLDRRFELLARTHPLGENHPAVRQYRKVMDGAANTVKSIIISVNARLAFLENEDIKQLLEMDELDFGELGTGRNGDKRTKTALFIVTPDSDKSYAFLVGMLYEQMMQELYFQADTKYGGRLPIHVTMYLDEFYNTPLPDSYLNFLSTMRSREISNVIVVQNIAQVKELFKDGWETIPGNADTLIYLGGNEQSSHKYISELLGKSTIDKRSSGETLGKRGSSSRNYDVLGRELMTPDEVRKLDNRKCIVLIRGCDPVIDNKFNTFRHPMFKKSGDGEGKWYTHNPEKKKGIDIIDRETADRLKQEAGEDGNVIVTTIRAEELISFGNAST